MIIKKVFNYFSAAEKTLWGMSLLLIIVSFCIFDRENYLTLSASIIGSTSLILNAKGNPSGQVLTVIFSLFYGVISYTFSYYGEMITYLGMTAPMAIITLVSWLKKPLQRQQGRGRDQFAVRIGNRAGSCTVRDCHRCVLFYFKVYEYRKSDPEHHICHNKPSCCIPDLQTKSALCNSIRV